MKVLFEDVLFGGIDEGKNGKKTVLLLEDGKVRKVIASAVEGEATRGDDVNVVVEGVSSVFNDFGDLKIQAALVRLNTDASFEVL